MTRPALLLFTALLPAALPAAPAAREADIVIYGGTSAGLAAGIQAARMGRSVLVLEPTTHLGGLTTGGLGQTDIGNKQAIGGLAREFYRGIRRYYAQPASWRWQTPAEYRDEGQTRTGPEEDTMWTFEPSAASAVFQSMIQAAGLEVLTGQRLDRSPAGVEKSAGRLTAIRCESGLVVRGRMFIDATYEGDLLATAGATYTLGRESNATYRETVNGVQADRYSPTLARTLSLNAANHQLADRVDPYIVPGDPSSGVLPGIRPSGPGIEGEGDSFIQAYCFRACLTNHPENRIPFPRPADYDELRYELLFRHLERNPRATLWINSPMPNRKTDTNNGGGFSGDFIGQNHAYPEASYAEREAIIAAHRSYQLGLYWTLANHPRVPASVRDKVSPWGLPRDEFTANGHWPTQLYIREARRLVGRLVMTQHHCEGLATAPESVGLAAYGMDSHHVQRYIDANGYARNEGNMQAKVLSPFPVGRAALLPQPGQADNLLVPVCLSASHAAYGSIRMEPVFMVLGQSAATLAALSLDHQTLPADLPYDLLAARLLADHQILAPQPVPTP